MSMMPRRALAVAMASLLAQGASGLYADEAGKLDWHRQNLGRFASAAFDGRDGVTVVGEASTIASVDSSTGELVWRQVLSPEDTILATSYPSARTPATATVSSGGRIVRLWSPVDGSMMWETALGVGDPPSAEPMEAIESAGVVSTERGYVVVLSAGGIHVLAADTGAVLAQWWCEPAREPDLAALVGLDVQVAFTSLRLVSGDDGRLLAGGWSKKKGVKDADAFVVAEINPSERLVTFKAAKVSDLGVDPSAGVTLAHTHGNCGGTGGGEPDQKGLAVVGLSGDGSALAVFPAASDPPLAARAALPADIRGATGAVSSVSDLVGTGGGVLELQQGGGGSVAVSLTSGKGGGACTVSGLDGANEARLCAGSERGGGCALAGGVSVSGKTFVASASMVHEAAGSKVAVSVTEVTAFGDFMAALVDSFEASSPGLGGRIEEAYLEVEVPFRVLVVNEDDSAMMVGIDGVEWVREEALAAVDQVAFVDSSKDELSILAASAGEEVEHDVPGWRERLRLHRLELTTFVGKAHLQIMTGIGLPGSELLDTADTSHSSFGLKKLAICSTDVGKIYALDMADGSVAWSLFRPSWIPAGSKVLLYATRNKAALGYSPEVAVIAIGDTKTVVAGLDALTGLETYREEFDVKVASAVPLGVKDGQERSVIMLVDSDKLIHSVPSTAEASSALRGLLPQLFYHDLSDTGLESFNVVENGTKGEDESGRLGSAAVASLPFNPTRSKVVATAYPDRRDGVQTPAHTLGDDSLLIKYINPRLFAFATLSPEEAGSGVAGGGAGDLNGKGQELTVTLVDYVSGRLLHRISHKGASEPVHMQVSESWVVYSYWSAISHRTEMSTLSLYEGMIDKYGLSPFNRPEWKEEFSSFESRVPIVLQKTFIFPLPVTALGITLTQYGITSKNILVGTAVGQVVSLDRRFLDPRRPQEEPTKTEKEEKLMQYQPYLPVVPTQVLSYYKVIERVNRVLTEPTGLESTSLVLAVGLDLFGARVAPSKTYDMLDPNFNYALLGLVLAAMTAAVAVANRFAAKKRLHEQWA